MFPNPSISSQLQGRKAVCILQQHSGQTWHGKLGGAAQGSWAVALGPSSSSQALRARAGLGGALNSSTGVEVPPHRTQLHLLQGKGCRNTNMATQLLRGPESHFPSLFSSLPLPTSLPQTYPCPLPDCTDETAFLFTPHLQPALLHWPPATSHIHPRATPQKSLPWKHHEFWNFAVRGDHK